MLWCENIKNVYFLLYIQLGNIQSSVHYSSVLLVPCSFPVKKKKYRVYSCEKLKYQECLFMVRCSVSKYQEFCLLPLLCSRCLVSGGRTEGSKCNLKFQSATWHNLMGWGSQVQI